jgi:PDZ domain
MRVSYVCSQDQQKPPLNNPSETASQQPASSPSKTPFGVTLGLVGANWEERGFKGVEIKDISEGGLAAKAGLHKGDVIAEVNGDKTLSTQDLNSVIAQMESCSRVRIIYFFRTMLGWMPKETSVVLLNEECKASAVAPSATRTTDQAAREAVLNQRRYAGGDNGALGLGQRQNPEHMGPVEVTTDTEGVHFGPYLQRVVHDVKLNWYALIPEAAMPPLLEKGKVVHRVCDPRSLPERIVAAKEAVQSRLKDIQGESDHHEERQQIEDALNSLRILEREK